MLNKFSKGLRALYGEVIEIFPCNYELMYGEIESSAHLLAQVRRALMLAWKPVVFSERPMFSSFPRFISRQQVTARDSLQTAA